jgi:hypothetical protein
MLFPIASVIKGITMLSSLKKGVDQLKAFKEENGSNSIPSELEKKVLTDLAQKSIFQSKKFWVTILSFLIPILNSKLGWGLDVATLSAAIVPLLVYVAGLAHIDSKK